MKFLLSLLFYMKVNKLYFLIYVFLQNSKILLMTQAFQMEKFEYLLIENNKPSTNQHFLITQELSLQDYLVAKNQNLQIDTKQQDFQ